MAGKTDEEVAETSNEFYSRFSEGTDSIKKDEFDLSACVQTLPLQLTFEETEKLLRSVNLSKGAGPDGIPAWVLKELSFELGYPVSYLFNRSLKESVVPKVWKQGEIIPVPKMKICTKLKDLRPITKTPLLGKLLQKPFCQHLQTYTKQCSDPLQFGFTQGKSTNDALIHTWDFILRGLESKESVAVFAYFIDYSSAFDSVRHSNFINCLIQTSPPRWMVEWSISFLQDRKQYVNFNGTKSASRSLKCGFPQGENASSPFFNISTDPIAINTRKSKFNKFADDSTMLYVVTCKKDHDQYLRNANWILQKSEERGLKLNSDKCKEICFDFTKDQKFKNSLPPIKVGDTAVERVNSFKLLGTILSADLSWSKQVDKIERGAFCLLRQLYRLVNSGSSAEILKTFTESYIYPAITYASPLFLTCLSEAQKRQLSRIDKRVSRALRDDSLQSYEQRATKLYNGQLKRMVNRGDPLFSQQREVPYNLRSGSTKQDVPFARTSRYQKTFVVTACRQLRDSV